MTTVVKGPNMEAGYVPEGYTATLNSMTHWPWPDGTTQEQVRESEHTIMRAVIEVAEAYGRGDALEAQRLVALKLPDVPADWSPLRYFRRVAQEMAVPVWEQYTAQQRQRGYEYAARYVRRKLIEWLEPRGRKHATAEELAFKWTDAPEVARRKNLDQAMVLSEYRRWLTMLMAYLATHPDDEVVPAQMRAIKDRWTDFRSPQAFF